MTLTAQPTASGRVATCDQAACNRPATVAHDAWMFCPEHARRAHADDAALVITARGSALVPGPAPVRHVENAQARRSAAAVDRDEPDPPPVTSSPLGLLLEQATGHTVGKVQRLAKKIEADLDTLRALIAEHHAGEQARKAELAAKKKARAEIARLEAELAAAKAKLRPGAATSTATTPGVCAHDGCTTPIVRAPGQRGVLAKRCPTHRAGGSR